MIEQLRNDPKTIPRRDIDEMMRMLYERWKKLENDYSIELKGLWVSNALDGSENYLVFEKLYTVMAEKMIEYRHELLQTPSPENLKSLLKLLTQLNCLFVRRASRLKKVISFSIVKATNWQYQNRSGKFKKC